MAAKIKAWTFTHGGFPKALHKTELPADDGPLKSAELRVQVKAASINPVDAQMMGFPLMPYLPSFLIRPNKGVGEDFSGVVLDAGKSSGFKTGDEVFGITPFLPTGTLQETIRIDTKGKEVVVLPKPTDWSWEQAGALPLVWLTARTCIAEAAPFVKNGKIAILGGSSSSGMYAVHMAKKQGWTVVATCSGAKDEFVRGMGASETIDYTTTSVPEKLRAFKPDAIIDCVGGTDCLGIAKRYVTVVGDKTDRGTMGGRNIYLWNPQMLLRAVLGRANVGASYACVNLSFKKPFLEEILSLPKDKIIIDSTYDFDEVKEAFERLNTGRTKGKVVIKVAV